MKWPKVTVVVSTFNRPDMLKRCVRAIVAQTFRDFEIIVVDDASETAGQAIAEILDELGEIRVRVLEMPEHTGYSSAPMNCGIFHARGSYIAYCDDDNFWDTNHLQVLVDKIEESRADFVYSRWRYGGDGPNSGMEFPYSPPTRASLTGLIQSPQNNFIDTTSILHSKGALISKLGPHIWDEDKRRFGDWDLATRCAIGGVTFASVDNVTFTYWWHDKNLQKTRSANEAESTAGNPNSWRTNVDWSEAGEMVWRG